MAMGTSQFKPSPKHPPLGTSAKGIRGLKSFEGLELKNLAVSAPKEQAPTADDILRVKIQEEEKKLEGLLNETTQIATVFRDLVVQIEEEKKIWLQNVQKQLLEMILYVAEKVVDFEVTANPEIIAKCVRTLIEEEEKAERSVIHVNPDDYQTLLKHHEKMVLDIKNLPGFEIVEDTEIPRGSCRLDATHFRMEAGISKRLSYLWNELLPLLPEKNTDVEVPENNTEEQK